MCFTLEKKRTKRKLFLKENNEMIDSTIPWQGAMAVRFVTASSHGLLDSVR